MEIADHIPLDAEPEQGAEIVAVVESDELAARSFDRQPRASARPRDNRRPAAARRPARGPRSTAG